MAYHTPVLGYPLSIPFGFPLYQGVVAISCKVLGTRLEPTGRILGVLFLLTISIPIYFLCRHLELHWSTAPVFLSLLWTSPTYLFWGRSFLIETTSLTLLFCALPFAVKLVNFQSSASDVLLCSIFFTLSILQKVTTAAPILGLCALFSLGNLLFHKTKNPKTFLFTATGIAVAFAIPLLAGIAWTLYTDSIKNNHPVANFLTSSALRSWNFGDPAKRLGWTTWKTLIFDRVLSLHGSASLIAFLIFLGLALERRYIRLILCASLFAFFLPLIVFTNLHVTHDYYQVATTCFYYLGLQL